MSPKRRVTITARMDAACCDRVGKPRERQADAQFAAADVESGERPTTGSSADKRLDGEGPEVGGVTGHEVLGLVRHF
jgi:hypothetical protein